MSVCTWSTTMFRYLAAMRDCAVGIMRSKVSQENIAHDTMLCHDFTQQCILGCIPESRLCDIPGYV